MNKQVNIEPVSLHMAMAMAFSEIEAATKSANNPHFKSKYADLGAVIEAVKPALIKHSLFFTQLTHDAPGGVCVETVIHHSNGDSMSGGKLFVPASKNDPQAYGSALTYARRYSLQTFAGVPAEDDDGNAAVKAGPAKATGLIDDGQVTVLQGFAMGGVIDETRFCKFFEIKNFNQLPANRYDEAVRMAQAKQAKQLEPVQ